MTACQVVDSQILMWRDYYDHHAVVALGMGWCCVLVQFGRR